VRRAAVEDIHLDRGDVYIYGWLAVNWDVAGTAESGHDTKIA
jgi:hypothetical protein